MQNPKFIGLFAGLGFVLSLIIGLFSGVKFLPLSLRALLSALCSGLLAWAIMFLYEKVFGNLHELEGQEVEEGAKEGTKEGAKGVLGSYVNVSLGDDSLPEEENAPQFFVNHNYVAKKADSSENKVVQKEAREAIDLESTMDEEENTEFSSNDDENARSSFQPKPLVASQVNTGAENSSSNEEYEESKAIEEGSSIAETLDDLPNISVISREMGTGVDETKDMGTGTLNVELVDGEPEQDSSTMAQAIRTVLAKDS